MSPPACCHTAPAELRSEERATKDIKDPPPCCPPGSWPQLLRSKDQLNEEHAPAPKGSVVTVPTDGGEDLPIYFVEPAKKSLGSIMVLPDIYSVRVLTKDCRSGDRIGSICDALAEKGYTVALPSIFRDLPYDKAVSSPSDGDFVKFDCFGQDGGVAWFQAQNYAKVGPDVKACAKFLSDKTGQPLGVVGFCYGTWLLSKACAMGDVDFKCALGCHPATQLEAAVFGGDEIAMLKDLTMPTKFLWAGNDSDVYTGDGEGKAALEKTGGGVVEFADMLHGWVSRGDVSDEKVKRDAKAAIDLMMSFLDENMPKID